MITWTITVRYGQRYQRYHTLEVDGRDIRDALRLAADEMGDEIADVADLVEVRRATDPEARSYVGEDG